MKSLLPYSFLVIFFVLSSNIKNVVAKNKWIFIDETVLVSPDGSREKTGMKHYWRPVGCNDNSCIFQTLRDGEYVDEIKTHELLCEEKLSRITFVEQRIRGERRFKPVEVINTVLPSIWYDFQQSSRAKLPYKSMCNSNSNIN